jgi:hypothetical protein
LIQNSVVTVSDAGVVAGASISGATNTLSNINLSSQVTGTLPLANGGTNSTSAPQANATLMGWTTTTTSSGTTTLTNASTYQQYFTGVNSQNIYLPVTSTLALGWAFEIINDTSNNLNIYSSGGASFLGTVQYGTTGRVVCKDTSTTLAAAWEIDVATGFPSETGQGAVVRQIGSFMVSPTMTDPTASAQLLFVGSTSSQAQFATNQTTANTDICTSQTTGTLTIGGTSGSGTQTFGRSVFNQTTNIQAGATQSGYTKQINIGTGGLTGSNTAITIGTINGYVLMSGQLALWGASSKTAEFATDQTTAATTICTSQTTGALTIGGTGGTGTQTFGRSTATQTTNIQAGATASGSTKTMNIGTGGLAGSTTNIAVGSTTGTSTTTLNGALSLQNALSVANGGTGQTTYTDGQLLIGNSTGNTLTKTTLTAGSGITITNGSGAITIAASGGGDVTGPASSTDNAITRFDSTTGKLIQNSLVTVADDGAITAPQVGSMIPFYYVNQAAFPSAATSHGAIAHSHADGAMFYAHGGSWVRLFDYVVPSTAGNVLTSNGTTWVSSTPTSAGATKAQAIAYAMIFGY